MYWTYRLRYGPHLLALLFAYVGIFYFITFCDEPSRWPFAILVASVLAWILWKVKKRGSKYRMVYLQDGDIAVGEFGNVILHKLEEIEEIFCDPKRLYQDATIRLKDGTNFVFIPRDLDPWTFNIKEPELVKELNKQIKFNQAKLTTSAGARRLS